ncbi:MAG: hypothetical protein IPI07_18855 [Flavobacteriales bacterium]|nr:hypothetical protein [Flavobacteriales bacterium]
MQEIRVTDGTFPDVIGGPSSGIGDVCADGGTPYGFTCTTRTSQRYHYAYAYKWVPGDATAAIDTVPMHGEQPYGIALKGTTLFYVTDKSERR